MILQNDHSERAHFKRNKSLFALMILASVIGCGGGNPTPVLQCAINKTGRYVLTGGLGVANNAGASGTLGMMVHSRESGRPLVLTNYHVSGPPGPNASILYVSGTRGPNIGLPIAAALGSGTDWSVVSIDVPGLDYDTKIQEVQITGVNIVNFASPIIFYDRLVKHDFTTGIPAMGNSPEFQFTSQPPGNVITFMGNSGSVILDKQTNNVVGLLHSQNLTGLISYAEDINNVLRNANVTFYDPEVNPVGFFRYKNKSDPTIHLYTTDWGEIASGLGSNQWDFENRQGAMFRHPAADIITNIGTTVHIVAFYRYQNSNNDFLYSTNLEHGNGDELYCLTGVIGYIPDGEIPGKTIKLYRYNKGSDHHFYTIDATESAEALANGWIPDDPPFYYVFSQDGSPDPPILYQEPAHTKINLDSNCSTAEFRVNGTSGVTHLTGSIDLTIGPDCTDPLCSLTIAGINLTGSDFSLAGHSVTQTALHNMGYALGAWMIDNTFTLPNLSTTVLSSLELDGQPLSFVTINNLGPLRGTLARDYTGFTLSGDFANEEAAVRINLCGHVAALPPVATLTPPGPFQCDSADGAHVTFSSEQSYDPDNDLVHRLWKIDNRIEANDVVTLSTILSLGAHLVSVAVSDTRGATSIASKTVNVIDTRPPQLSVSVESNCLWPPNHKNILFSIGRDVSVHNSDACDLAPTIRIVKVTSNQPPGGGGSGSTPTDVQFGSQAFCVRAERDGTQTAPREYTVTFEAADHTGNTTTQQLTIFVPHDKSGGDNCDINPHMIAHDDDPRCRL